MKRHIKKAMLIPSEQNSRKSSLYSVVCVECIFDNIALYFEC